ncbi:vacuolar iron transporter homolog 4 [Ziziphus jujuba]|uniref:Vacuolar iron transporter n=1 Tax=Ziziphus jujuba TaxID=326968 RepID=A0A6P3ZC67_ZIZJJ|nr:vacuolar iron transporter homolog 4 [Ziziphus jujuba]
MASLRPLDQISTNQIEIPVYNNTNQAEQKQYQGEDDNDQFDYSQRAQWLRAALLGANDGLVSVSSLMMGVGAVKEDVKAMLLAGFAGLVAGACSMAIGEFVSVYTQYDIERAQMKRDTKNRNGNTEESGKEDESEKEKLPNPTHAAMASAMAFTVGALVPLLAAAFIKEHKLRLGVVAAVASFALVIFGGVGAVLGRTPAVRSCARVLVGGWVAMAITFGLTKLIGTKGMEV